MPDTNTSNNQNNQNTNADGQNTNNQNIDNQNTNNQNNTNTSGGCVYDKFGRSPDGKTICGIGLPSAPNDEGSGFTKNVFENKCPHCGQAKLKWAWNFGSTFEGEGEGGSTEGHFFCTHKDGGCDADYSAQGNEHIFGSTYAMTRISGPVQSTKEEAQQLVDGKLPCDDSSGGTTSGSSGSGGGGVKIEDVTFYGLIKQIIGATDGLFIIANNMAYLLSFQEMFKYRDEYKNHITQIDPSDVLQNSLQKDWDTSGYYNTVEVTYSEGTVKYSHDVLVKQYGENVFYYDYPDDDYETAKIKAQALLAAHVRDYSTDIQLQIFYNPNITVGSWIKVKKTITQLSGKTRKEKQQEQLKKSGKKIETKRKGINITNISEEIIKKDNTTKKVQHLTDEKGTKINIEEEQSDYDLFFVQGYTCRWDEHNSLIMDIQLKYGPDTPEDPVSAGGGSLGSSNTSVDGQSADINEFVKKALQGASNDNKSKVEAIYKAMVDVVRYSNYPCSKYKTASKCLKNASSGLNCADSSRLGRACYAAGGFNSKVVTGPGHFWVEVEVDGQWIGSDVTGAEGQACVRKLGEIYNNLQKTGECGDEPSC